MAATTSSMGLLANELRPIAVPRGRSGPGHRHLAVGVDGLHPGRGDEHREGDLLPHDLGGQVALSASPATCGANPSSANALTLSSTVMPRSDPAMSAP